uniref:Uncharacterized protein n=1 Tax=Meloidogyne incognita TaxID=6306 RepID=A0A914M7W3_MELIC
MKLKGSINLNKNKFIQINFKYKIIDVHLRLPNMTNNETDQLILYAMAGAGFQHFDVFNNLVTKEELIKLTKLISLWRGNRTKLAFYQFLFEINGFKCEERQLIVYLSQQYEDIPTFPRFYLNNNYWYRLRLKKKHISLLNPNQHCSPVEKYIKRGNCYVDSWLK